MWIEVYDYIYSKNKKDFKTLAKKIVDKETGFTAKTRKEIAIILKSVNPKEFKEKYKAVKNIKRIKCLTMETLENIPVLSISKVNGLQTMMNGLK